MQLKRLNPTVSVDGRPLLGTYLAQTEEELSMVRRSRNELRDRRPGRPGPRPSAREVVSCAWDKGAVPHGATSLPSTAVWRRNRRGADGDPPVAPGIPKVTGPRPYHGGRRADPIRTARSHLPARLRARCRRNTPLRAPRGAHPLLPGGVCSGHRSREGFTESVGLLHAGRQPGRRAVVPPWHIPDDQASGRHPSGGGRLRNVRLPAQFRSRSLRRDAHLRIPGLGRRV